VERRLHVLSVEPREDPLTGARGRALARHVLRYLLDHPGAKDTAEGIREWWFHEGDMPDGREMQRALDALVERGWLTRTGTTEPVYGLGSGEPLAVRAFLEDGGGRADRAEAGR
jgi:hypothetical protein